MEKSMTNESKPSLRERLIGKPLIGFDTREPRQPAAMVGTPTVKAVSRAAYDPTVAPAAFPE
jgi:hypothetical protein